MKRKGEDNTTTSNSNKNANSSQDAHQKKKQKTETTEPTTTHIGRGILQGKFVFEPNDNDNNSTSIPSTFLDIPAKTEAATGKRPGHYPKLDVKQNILNPMDRLNMITSLIIDYGCNSNVIADYENGLWQYIYDDLKQQTNIAGSNRPPQFLTLVLGIMKHLCTTEHWWSSAAYALLTFARKPNEAPAQWAKKFINYFDAITIKGRGLPFPSFIREIQASLPSLLGEPLFPIKECKDVYEFLNKVQALPAPIITAPTPTVVVTAEEPKLSISNRNNNTHDFNNRRDSNNRQNNQNNNQNQKPQTKITSNQTQCWFHKLSDTDKRSFSHQATDCTTLQNLATHLGRQIAPTTDSKELNELHQIAAFNICSDFIVDSGSTHSFVNTSFVEKYSLKTIDCSLKIQLVNNTSFDCTFMLFQFQPLMLVYWETILFICQNHPQINLSFLQSHLAPTTPAKIEPIRLQLKANSNRVFAPQPNLSHKQTEDISNVIRLYVEMEFIKKLNIDDDLPFNERWNIPILAAEIPAKTLRFKDNSTYITNHRLVIDARRLNQILIESESNHVPLPQDLLRNIFGFWCISLIDISDFYWSYPLHSDSQKYTSFTFKNQRFCCLRLPPGINFISGLVQKHLSSLLKDLAQNYLDDTIAAAMNRQEAIPQLVKIIDILTENGFHINQKKTLPHLLLAFGIFLGKEIHNNHINIDTNKIETLKAMAIPRTRTSVESFIGFIGFLRGFTPSMSDLLLPFRKLLHSNAKTYSITNELEKVFQRIIDWICLHHTLALPQPNLPFEIHTDASETAAGAFICQRYEDGLQIIEYFSKAFTPSQSSMDVWIRELLAIHYSFIRFHAYIAGSTVHVFTDSQVIAKGAQPSSKAKQVQRYLIRISQQRATFNHINGKDNWFADSLSRANIQFQHNLPTIFFTKSTDYLTPPISERNSIIENTHKFGHFGYLALVKKIHDLGYNWTNISADCQRAVSSCILCAAFQPIRKPHHNAISPGNAIDNINQLWEIDIKHFPESNTSNKQYCLTIVDWFSGFCWLHALETKSSAEIALYLTQIICTFGSPSTILTDAGAEFDSTLIKELTETFSIILSHSQPYKHNTTGKVERRHLDIHALLSKLTNGNWDKWDSYLPLAQLCLNTLTSTSSGITPYQIQLGKPFTGLPSTITQSSFQSQTPPQMMNPTDTRIEKVLNHYQNFFEFVLPAVQERISNYTTNQLQKLDKSRKVIPRLTPGTIVTLRDEARKSKFDPIYNGEFMIISCDELNNYQIKSKNSNEFLKIPIEFLKIIGKPTSLQNEVVSNPQNQNNNNIISNQNNHHQTQNDNSISNNNQNNKINQNEKQTTQTKSNPSNKIKQNQKQQTSTIESKPTTTTSSIRPKRNITLTTKNNNNKSDFQYYDSD